VDRLRGTDCVGQTVSPRRTAAAAVRESAPKGATPQVGQTVLRCATAIELRECATVERMRHYRVGQTGVASTRRGQRGENTRGIHHRVESGIDRVPMSAPHVQCNIAETSRSTFTLKLKHNSVHCQSSGRPVNGRHTSRPVVQKGDTAVHTYRGGCRLADRPHHWSTHTKGHTPAPHVVGGTIPARCQQGTRDAPGL
jgi:hypothetical protein